MRYLFLFCFLCLSVPVFGASITIHVINNSDINLSGYSMSTWAAGGHKSDGTYIGNSTISWSSLPAIPSHTEADVVMSVADSISGNTVSYYEFNGFFNAGGWWNCSVGSSQVRCPASGNATCAVGGIVDFVYDGCSLSSTSPPCTTNVTLTVYNDSSSLFGQVSWYKDGTLVAQDLVSPLTHDSHEFDALPCDYSGTINAVMSYPNNQPYSAFTNNSDIPLTLNLTNSWTGGSFTNWTPPDPSVNWWPNTNNIVWAPSDGTAAQDNTLKAGFGQIHDDMQKQIQDFNSMIQKLTSWNPPTNFQVNASITNNNVVVNTNINSFSLTNFLSLDGLTNSINAQTFAVTNGLGRIEVYARSNNDAAWQLVGLMTNLPGSISNALAGLTNNSPTNYATESTLLGMSNQLASFHFDFTNFISSTNFDTNGLSYDTSDFLVDSNYAGYMDTTGYLSGASVDDNLITNLADAITRSDADATSTGEKTNEDSFLNYATEVLGGDFSGDVPDYYPAVDMTFDFTPFLGGASPHVRAKYTTSLSNVIDFDPLHYDWGVEMFSVVRGILSWALALWYLLKVTEDAWKVVMVIENASAINAVELRKVIKNSGTQGLPGNPIV